MKMKLHVKFDAIESDALNFVARALGISNEEFVRLSTIKSINMARQALVQHERNTDGRNNSQSTDNPGAVEQRQSGTDSAALSDSGN